MVERYIWEVRVGTAKALTAKFLGGVDYGEIRVAWYINPNEQFLFHRVVSPHCRVTSMIHCPCLIGNAAFDPFFLLPQHTHTATCTRARTPERLRER